MSGPRRVYRRLFGLGCACCRRGASHTILPWLQQAEVADGLQRRAIVELVDPFERGVSRGFEGSLGWALLDDVSLLRAVDQLGQRIGSTVAD